ncbi:MAG: RNA polymerase sigma factor [Actinomycetota bacterium]
MTEGDYDDLFRDAYPRLVAFALAMATPRSVAQELAQETLVRAYEHRDRLARMEAPYGWCRRVMSNLLIDQHRTRAAERAALTRLAHSPEAGEADDAILADPVDADAWRRMLAPLTVRQRCIATLFYAEDASVARIADDLGLSEGTVKTSLSRIRHKVSMHLRERSEHGEART